jgi:translation initiation factor 2 subunit 3
MLNAASAMDAAVLVVAANAECPMPQTAEHLAAADLMNLKRYVVIQNKVDLVSADDARTNHEHIRSFLQGTGAEVYIPPPPPHPTQLNPTQW